MLVDILTALPGIVEPVLGQSILKRAADSGRVRIRVHDLRAFTSDPHRQVDDYPFGGGAGMVLKPEPIFECVDEIRREAQAEGHAPDEIIYLTPDGDVLDQGMANELSLRQHLILIAGHYKGVDQRVRDELVTREISVGDYVLSGGELPALVLVDAVVRLVPGVLGDAMSALSDSFQDDLLAAPIYTRPAVYRGLSVPPVLLSGNHRAISEWREAEQMKKTSDRRPDLLRASSSAQGSGSENRNEIEQD
jgi:tRNA (guanine37-N1)-methyltransferase